MKSTGITRKIDELGRIVIPKEIRRNLSIRDGETLEIFIESDGILLKKHSQIKSFSEVGNKLCKIISNVIDVEILITDREKIVAESLENKYVNENLPQELLSLIDNRESLKSDYENKIILGTKEIVGYFNIVPIISSSDSLGLVIIISKTNVDYMNISKLIAKILSEKVDIY